MPQLKDFQREDVDFIKSKGLRVLIASSPGCGKTAVAIRSIAETHQWSLPAVVICPASVTRNWAKEVHMWAPGIRVAIIDDGTTQIPEGMGRNTIYIISWSLIDARWPDLIGLGYKTIVGDEAHFVKNPDALRSQALRQLTEKAKGLLLLSGTPIINSKEELAALKDFFGTIEPPMLRRLLEDVAPEVPQKSRSYVYITLKQEDREDYDQANDDFENWLRAEKAKLLGEGMSEYEISRTLAAEALAKIGYLRRLVGVAKADAAVEWIAKAVRVGEPVVVFCEHQDTLHRMMRGLKKARILHGVIEGSTPAHERQELIDGFQAYKFPVFLGTKAAKEGITLTRARHLLFVERFYTSAEEEQAEDRIRRLGQTHPTTIWFLHAIDTVDDRVDTIVKSKRQLIRTAIEAKEIAETPIGNVEGLLTLWDKHASPDGRKIQTLGHGNALPPLPKPKDAHAILFYGERWKTESAAIWCKMNGYVPQKKVTLVNRFKLIVEPAEVFKPGDFSVFDVCSDIKIIKGKRVSKANERRIVSSLKRTS